MPSMNCIGYDGDCSAVLTCFSSTKNATSSGVHTAAYVGNSRTSMSTGSAANSSTIAGSPKGCTPISIKARPGCTSRPKISQIQIVRRAVRLVLVADHPQRDHAARVIRRLGPQLEPTVLRRIEPLVGLCLPDDGVLAETVLTDPPAFVPGEDAGLQRRHPNRPVELRAPRRLVPLDAQAQQATAELISRRGALAAAPLRQVVRQPSPRVEDVRVERILELQLVAHAAGIGHRDSFSGLRRPGTASLRLLVYASSRMFSSMMAVFDVLTEPTRRRILDVLLERPHLVGELTKRLGLTQPGTSKHLHVLREAGLVRVRAEAQRRWYELRPGPLAEVDAWLALYRWLWTDRIDALERHLATMPDDEGGDP